jgi:citrate lyase beta subunit
MSTSTDVSAGPLKGLRVLDLGTVYAAPITAMLLSGFFGKSAIHPRQLDILHEVFTPSEAEIEWALSVLDGFERVGGGGFALPSGEFVDLPVADRARRLLNIAGVRPAVTGAG